MAALISSSILACLKSFNEFIEEIRHSQQANPDAGAWEDELGRLRMWAANIGAHQTGQSSLDFRLRDASHIREQIVKLLQGLLRRLDDARVVLAEDGESDDEEAADELMNEEDSKTEIQELQESVATTINCLFQMSILVRKPAQHDFHQVAKENDVAVFEPVDYNYVREKYPRADDALVKRLGNAITRRRKYLKYRKRHAIKLKQGIDNVGQRDRDFQGVHEGETMKEGTTSILSDTVATDFQLRNIDFDDNASDTGTQTSLAPTLLSGGNVTIPPPAKSSLGGVPFECPYCFYLITVHGTRSWNKHVFQDLQPYICTFPTCVTPEKLYPTRHEWVHHSNKAHPREETKGFAACPLCTEPIDVGEQYDRHLARHLQELALFVLPGSEDDSEVNDDQEAESRSSANSIDPAASRSRPMSLDGRRSSLVEYNADNGKVTLKQEEEEGEEEAKKLKKLRQLEAKLEAKFETQLTERRTVLGSEHPETLATMSALAYLYSEKRRFDEALNLAEQVMVVRNKVLGREHPDTLTSVINLAVLYRRQGQLTKAEALFQQVLYIREKTLGPDHESTLDTVISLGYIYDDQGRLEEAESMYHRAINVKKQLDRDRLWALKAVAKLGDVQQKQGKLVGAEEIFKREVTGKDEKLGHNHPSTLEAVARLVDVYRKQGKLAEADEMYQRFQRAETKNSIPTRRL